MMSYLIIECPGGNVELFAHLQRRFAFRYSITNHDDDGGDDDDDVNDDDVDEGDDDDLWQNVRCRRSVMIIPNCLRRGQ